MPERAALVFVSVNTHTHKKIQHNKGNQERKRQFLNVREVIKSVQKHIKNNYKLARLKENNLNKNTTSESKIH